MKMTPKADAEVLARTWGFHCILCLESHWIPYTDRYNLRIEQLATLAGHYAYIALQEAS
jgi:hypothetical protein